MSTTKGDTKKIKLDDDYTLNIDKWNYWITKKAVIGEKHRGGKSKNAGAEVDRAYDGYHTSFTNCMESFFKLVPAMGESKSLTALLKEEKDAEKRIKGWCEKLEPMLKAYYNSEDK